MNLEELRKEINAVDDQLLPLFLKRMELSKLIGQEKQKLGFPIENKIREAEILQAVAEKSGNMNEYAVQLYEKLFELSKAYQAELKNQHEE